MAKSSQAKKQRWYHQVWTAYTMTRAQDPAVTWAILAAFFIPIAAGVGVSLLTGGLILWLPLAILVAFVSALLVLTRRAERAAYTRIEGQTGAARSAMGTVRGGWTFDDEPVFVSPRTQDVIFRGVGRAGVVLVSEGPPSRAKKILDDEQRRTNRLVPNVPVTCFQVGNQEGQVPLRRLARSIQKLKPALTKQETEAVTKRLQALGSSAKMSIPKGVDPMRARPDRKGMRGR